MSFYKRIPILVFLLALVLAVLLDARFTGKESQNSNERELKRELRLLTLMLNEEQNSEPHSKNRRLLLKKILEFRILRLWQRVLDGDLSVLDRERPFPKHSAMYYGLRSRLKEESGKSFDHLFLKGFRKHFFMGLNAGEEGFERKSIYFFPRPMTYEEYLSRLGKFTVVRLSGKQYGVLILQRKSKSLIYILDLMSLGQAAIRKERISQLKELFPVSESGFFTTFPVGLRVLAWTLFLLPIFMLVYRWNLVHSSFLFRLILSYLLFMLFTYLIGRSIQNRVLRAKKGQILESIETEFLGIRNKLEAGVDSYLRARSEKIKRAFQSGVSITDLPRLKGAHFFLADTRGNFAFHDQDIPLFLKDIMLWSAPVLIGRNKESGIADEKEFGKYFRPKSRLSQLPFSSKQLVRMPLGFLRFPTDEFNFTQVLSWELYWFWSKSGKGRDFRFLACLGKKEDIIPAYFQNTSLNYQSEKPVLIQVDYLDSQAEGTILGEGSLDEGETELLYSSLSGLESTLQIRKVQNRDHLIMSLPGENLSKIRYLLAFPMDLAFQELRTLERSFQILSGLFLSLGFFLLLFLSNSLKRFINRVARSISEVKQGNLEVEMPEIEFDERGLFSRVFNSSVQGLRDREALLPFVAHQLLLLLKNEEGGYHREIESRAAVLFCDIRSFTTISETYDPADVVEMLNDYFQTWQRIVEKHGGIVDKFIGDAIEVVFFKQSSEDYLQKSFACAGELMSEMEDFNARRANRKKFTIKNGIGICEGMIRFGVIGSKRRRHFLAQGEPVVEAEEFEALSKQGRHSKIFTDEATAKKYGIEKFDEIILDGVHDKLFEFQIP